MMNLGQHTRSMRLPMVGLWIAAVMAGCANYSVPVGPSKQLTVAERNFETLWQASREVLRKYRFELDREDRRAGFMVTEPMTGKVAGEFWRKDAATGRDLAEGTLQTIYRQAKVTIQPVAGDAEKFRALVEVRTYRSNRQEPQVTSTSDAYDMFRLPGEEGRRKSLLDYGKDEVFDAVEALGRDDALEKQLSAEILVASGKMR